jgi:hypothetical protein
MTGFGGGGFGLDAAQFTVLAALVRVVFGHRPMGDHFGLPVPIDWRRAATAAVGVAGAVAGGWLAYGPGLLPSGASLVVAFVAGGVCERLADRWFDRAEPGPAPDVPSSVPPPRG